MDIKTTIEILHWFQKYRRGNCSYEELQKHCGSKEIGLAIDFALKQLRGIKNSKSKDVGNN